MNLNSPNSFVYSVLEVNTTVLGGNPVPDLNTIQITSTAPIGTPISLIFDQTSSTLNGVFGYLNGINLINGPGSNIQAPNPYNLNFEDSIYLISDCVNSVVNDNNYSNNTLAVISVGSVPYGTFVTQSYDMIANMKPFNPSGRTFNFTITSENP